MATTEQIATVRLLIADTDPANQLLTDNQLTSLLKLNGDDERLAAADALETIAVSEVLVSKKIRTQDLQTDGPAVSAELRQLAKRLRDQVAGGESYDGFDTADVLAGTCRPERTDYPEVWGL